MTKANIFIGKICLLMMLLGFKMQAEGVEIYLANQKQITSKPGKVTTVVVNIKNETDTSLKLRPKFYYPKGWNSIADNTLFEIESGEQLTKLLSFIVPNQAPADNYDLVYELVDLSSATVLQSFSFSVQVEEIVNLSIKGIETPDYVIAGEYIQAKFVVRNYGNSEQTIVLTPYNCEIIGATNINLAPNKTKIVEVTTATNPNIQKVSRKSFRLEGSTLGEEIPLAHAYQHTRLIPNANAEINDIRRLPGYVKLTYIGRNQLNSNYISGWQGEIFTRGKLDKLGEKNVELRLRGPNQLNVSTLGLYDEYYALFNTPNYKIHLGDKTYSLSPLTEYARNGRGMETSVQRNHIEVGGFIQNPRFFPEIKKEIGTYVRHHFNSENSIRLNYLRKTYRASDTNASVFSIFGKFNPFKNTYIEGEFSHGYHQIKSGNAGYFKIESIPIKKLRLSSTILYASKNFPGYFTNTWFYTGSANYSVSPKINLFANIYQDEKNAARDTLFSTAPFSKRFQGGINFRLSQKTQIKGYLRHNELKDRLPSLKFHRLNRSLKLQIGQELRAFRLSTAIEYGLTEKKSNPDGQRVSKLFRTYLDINYRHSHRHHFRGFIQFFENNKFDNSNQQHIIFGISGKSKITKTTHLQFQYQNNFTVEEYHRDRNLFELHLTQIINRQHELTLSGRYALQRQTVNQGDFSVAAHYKYNFGIPLEGKKKQSKLLGQIFNTETESIEGIVLYLNGQTRVTDKDGQFNFKNLAPGKYYLLLDKSSMALHQIPDIQTPIEVKITEGQDAQISFGLTTSVDISGHLDIVPKKILINNKPTVDLPGPVLVELTNREETFRQVTETDGSFNFSGLRPGKWILNVISNSSFKNFIFEEEQFELNLKPGQKENIQIRVRKKERKIKFLQSFSLSSND